MKIENHFLIAGILLFLFISCQPKNEPVISDSDNELALKYTRRFLLFFCNDREYLKKYPCRYDELAIEKQSWYKQGDKTVFNYLIYENSRLVMDFHVYLANGTVHPLESNVFSVIAEKYSKQGKLN